MAEEEAADEVHFQPSLSSSSSSSDRQAKQDYLKMRVKNPAPLAFSPDQCLGSAALPSLQNMVVVRAFGVRTVVQEPQRGVEQHYQALAQGQERRDCLMPTSQA